MSDDEASKANEVDGKSEDEKSTKTTTSDQQKERTPRQKRRDRKKLKRRQGKQQAQKPTFKGATTEIQDHVFVYDPKHRAKYWLKSREAFVDYTGRKYGIDVKKSISNSSETIISVPKPTEYTDDEFKELQKKPYQLEEWRFDNKEYREARKKLRMNLGQLYSKLWGQCDTAMQNKIKSNKKYKTANESSDVIELLAIIDEICGTKNETKYYPLQQYLAIKKLTDFKQGDMTLAEYYQEFELLTRLAHKAGATFASTGMVQYVRENSDDSTINNMGIPVDKLKPSMLEKVLEVATDVYLATVFIQNADDNRYAVYKQHCHNSYVQGNDEYPTSVVDAYSALDQYKFDPNIYKKQSDDKTTIVAHGFLVSGEQEPEEVCYNCGRAGHYAKGCRHTTREDGAPTMRETKREKLGSQLPNLATPTSNTQEPEEQTSNVKSNETRETGINNLNVESDDDTLDGLYDDTLDMDDYRVESIHEASFYNENMNQTADVRGNSKHPLNYQLGHIRSDWILLDNCSTVNVFSNSDYLTNIRRVEEELHLYTNAGKAVINTKGWLQGIGDVWYHANGIANILSYNSIARMKGIHITYDNANGDDAFYVHNSQGEALRFVPSNKGLYHCKVNPRSQHILTNANTSLLTTIAGNKSKYSDVDVKRAERARRFQEIAGHLSEEQLLRIVRKNQLVNCPITPRDVNLMKAIFGPSVAGMKGKTVRSSKPAVTPNIIPIPHNIQQYYKDITLGIDIMYVNKIPFITSISRSIHYGTATPLRNSTNTELIEVIRQLQSFYQKRGFSITMILADGQFKTLEPYLNKMKITLNCVSKDEHVPEIERYHRTIKERCRCIYSTLQYKKLPKRLIVELIRTAIFYMNAFPWKGGVSNTLSPMAIVTGMAPDFNVHFQVPFGSYAQVREPTTNTMRARTTGAIATGPSRNHQGGMRFFSLVSGEILDRSSNDYKVCPIPNDVIDRVERMSRRSQQGLEFANRNQEITHADDEDTDTSDSDYEETGSVSSTSSDESNESSSQSQHDQSMEPVDDNIENTGVANQEDNDPETGITGTDTSDEGSEVNAELQSLTENDDDSESSDSASDSEDRSVNEDITRSSYGRRRNTGKLTKPMQDQYEYQYIQFSRQYETIKREEDTISTVNHHKALKAWNHIQISTIDGHIMMQYNLNAGLKKYGQEGKDATMKELRQMLRREVFEEIPRESLSADDKKKALPILLFLTAKRDGTIKGRACADGRKQRLWMQKEDSSSPTVAPEALFYTLVVDALEGRDVATCDLPGHFLQTDMEERLVLRIDGALAKLLVKLEPNRWKKHLHWNGGRPTIYVLCKKAIYGTLNAALLSYKKLIGHLSEWGFKMNPYEPCCWNKDVDGKQMTIVFHVDDLKISHKTAERVTEIIKKLESIYAKLDPMTVHRGKVHQYLGMTIDFRVKGEVRISMFDYIRKMIDILPVDMIGSKPTAAAEHLFKTSTPTTSEILSKEDSELFHSLTAMSLYLGKRARPDLQTPTAFLCTRVKSPDKHDWKKLSHMMKYLQSTRYLPLILRSDGKGTAIYIDGAHAVHADMKGHAGAVTTEGTGSVFASSTKNKLNTLSSTETEVVSTGEKLPKFVWYRNFRLSQGGSNKEDILYQDNKSAILLNKNGRMSCGKGSKHIGIRYFFITDRISRKEFRVEYCPTEEMLADYFTKPLQGSLFRKLRNRILGIHESDFGKYIHLYKETIKEFGLTDTEIDKISPQECVGG